MTPADERSGSVVAFGTSSDQSADCPCGESYADSAGPIEAIVVGDREFDSATHMLSMIYPNPQNPKRYLVINSGHTFHDAEFKGTNVLLNPRVGDWAVTDIGTGKVVAEGVFDRNWKLQ